MDTRKSCQSKRKAFSIFLEFGIVSSIEKELRYDYDKIYDEPHAVKE